MGRPRKRLSFALPSFISGGRAAAREWRELVHARALEARDRTGVRYIDGDMLAVSVRFYLPKTVIERADVDNRLKHVMDALQGALSGEKKKTYLPRDKRIIPNDRIVYRATVEKALTPRKRTATGGQVVISMMTRGR